MFYKKIKILTTGFDLKNQSGSARAPWLGVNCRIILNFISKTFPYLNPEVIFLWDPHFFTALKIHFIPTWRRMESLLFVMSRSGQSSPLSGRVGVQHAASLHPAPDVHASQRLLLQTAAASLDALLDPKHEHTSEALPLVAVISLFLFYIFIHPAAHLSSSGSGTPRKSRVPLLKSGSALFSPPRPSLNPESRGH